MQKIIVFGSSEIAELAKYYFEEEEKAEVVAFTVDDEYIKEDNFLGCPIVPFSKLSESFPPSEFNMHVALSYKRLNKLLSNTGFQKINLIGDSLVLPKDMRLDFNALAQGYTVDLIANFLNTKNVTNFLIEVGGELIASGQNSGYKLESFISNNSFISSNASIGDNCFILENQTIQPLVSIGSNVMLWSGNHIGHGTSIGDHSYLASHVVVSGNCKIGQRCFFGVNSTLKDYLEIGNDCFISMDASITKDLNNGSVVLPAKSNYFEADAELAIKIKKNYFGI